MQILKIIRKNILDRVIIQNEGDLVSDLYCLVFNVKDLDPIYEKVLKKQVLSIYMTTKFDEVNCMKNFVQHYIRLFKIYLRDKLFEAIY